MDSRHVDKGPKRTPQSAASHEDLEELSPVVDEKIVSDERSMPESVDAPKSTLDKIVLAIVAVGIIVFASFQISECVRAHEKPSSQTRVDNVARTFPGILICPFGNGPFQSICPNWSPDAALSFDFSGPGGRSPINLVNTNFDSNSQKVRSNSCTSNQFTDSGRMQSNWIWFATSGNSGRSAIGNNNRQVTVKNSARPLVTTDPRDGVTTSCNSWTPPNVRCSVFDPSFFDEATKTIPGLRTTCNPMREVIANSVDSMLLESRFDVDPRDTNEMYGGYTYSGLIRQTTTPPGHPGPNPFATAPSRVSVFTRELAQQGFGDSRRTCSSNVNMSIFGGVVAVLYDASKGIPKELDFDGARINSMSSDVLGSTVLLSTNVIDSSLGGPNFCSQLKFPPLSCTVTEQQEVVFTNAVAAATQTVKRQIAEFKTPVIPTDTGERRSPLPALSISFSSSLTVISTQFINLSILTTISIILSTAASLWGAQQKIKDGIILVIDKVKEFLDKRRAATKPSSTASS
jgi:hypothetical protein